jgi:hypothetical protein
MVGARFLFYIIPDLSLDQENESFGVIFGDSKRKKTKRKLTKLTSKFLNRLNALEVKEIKFSKESEFFLRTAARFISKARGVVIIHRSSFKNDEGKNITYYEPLDIQIEQPWRAVQQLMEMAKYLALVEEKDKVEEEELEIIKDITLSSMPADRAGAVKTFRDHKLSKITAKQLSDESDKSVKTSRRLLDELVLKYFNGKDTTS